jgi:outer membrane protein TolC
MKFILSVIVSSILLNANDIDNPLSLKSAIDILKESNLEIKSSKLEVKSSQSDIDIIKGKNYGKLEFIQDVVNSDNAGNVFGFKLTSREANFGDFGAEEFMNSMSNPNGPDYKTPPEDLNNPGSSNFFQSKLKYEVPLFTGFELTNYEKIMSSMKEIKRIDRSKVINEKIYELKKSYYDMFLLNISEKNLTKILGNIKKLESIVNEMVNVGYAKKIDLLEVQSKKFNLERSLKKINLNKKLVYHYISFLLNRKIENIKLPEKSMDYVLIKDKFVLNNNLDIMKATQGLKIRKRMIEMSENSFYYPKIGAFVEVSTADDTFLGDMNDHKSYTIGARLTWNLFNGGIDKIKIEKSRIEHLKTKTQIELAKKGIFLQIDKLKTEIDSFDMEISSISKELELLEEIYLNYEGRYKEKLLSIDKVLIKQSEQLEKFLQLQVIRNKRNERILYLEKIINGEVK